MTTGRARREWPSPRADGIPVPESRIGVIGLGLLGSAIAERLLASGFDVLGFDISTQRMASLDSAGGSRAESAAEVANACGHLVLSLPDSGVVRTVLEEIPFGCLAGRLVMDTTTGAPSDSVAFGRMLEAAGGHYLDTPVGGSSDQVRRQEAIVIAGGDDAALERCLPVLNCLGRRVFHVGPCGSGSSTKLVTNLVLGLNRAVLAEGLSFAKRCGLSPKGTLEVLKAGPAHSVAMDRKGHRMLSEDFAPEARLDQHLKDVLLILAEGERHGSKLPLSETHSMLLRAASALGFGGADNSAVIKAFE